MKSAHLPVLEIRQFDHMHSSFKEEEHDFYANIFSLHLKKHHFINTPHKHDFYLSMIFTRGKGTHEIDFKTYPIKPGTVFLMSPGQTHNWRLSKDIEGYIFFHSKEFFELPLTDERLRDYPFYQSVYENPCIKTTGKQSTQLKAAFEDIVREFEANKVLKQQALHSLVRKLYIDLARIYKPLNESPGNNRYLGQVKKLEALIDISYKTKKYPKEYAVLMGMSEKHLNRVCRDGLNKTTTELIAGRIILEAKRLLVQTEMHVYEVANELGYEDVSYFIRLFRKKEGKTPAQFVKRYKGKNQKRIQ